MKENEAATVASQKPEFEFSDAERAKAVVRAPAVEKPVMITFKTGSAELNERSKRTLNDEMVPMIENNGSAYFSVSGNTDSTGSRGANVSLSKQRATTVVQYLVDEWEFDRERFEIVGNGPDKPLCDEKNPDSYESGTSLEDCRELNRTVRLAVQSRN
jgi:outer membrane protein OmpA-like peptidoglycan-associated protein